MCHCFPRSSAVRQPTTRVAAMIFRSSATTREDTFGKSSPLRQQQEDPSTSTIPIRLAPTNRGAEWHCRPTDVLAAESKALARPARRKRKMKIATTRKIKTSPGRRTETLCANRRESLDSAKESQPKPIENAIQRGRRDVGTPPSQTFNPSRPETC